MHRRYDQKAKPGGSLDIIYRQPGNGLCLSTDVPGASFTPLEESPPYNAFAYCNYGAVMAGSSVEKADSEPLDKLKANYDPNRDGLVTDAEARTHGCTPHSTLAPPTPCHHPSCH